MLSSIVVLVTCKNEENSINQRTNGPVNAHLISCTKAQNIQNLENISKEMTLTFNTQIPSYIQLDVCSYYLSCHWLQYFLKNPLFSLFPIEKPKFLLNVFGIGVSCRKLYSFVVYLYVNGSGSITSVGEERANLSAVVYL